MTRASLASASRRSRLLITHCAELTSFYEHVGNRLGSVCLPVVSLSILVVILSMSMIDGKLISTNRNNNFNAAYDGDDFST